MFLTSAELVGVLYGFQSFAIRNSVSVDYSVYMSHFTCKYVYGICSLKWNC